VKIGLIHHDNRKKESLRDVIHRLTDHDVVWGTNYGLHALELCKSHRPDLILLDIGVIEYDGIQFVADLVSRINCPVLLTTEDLDRSSYWVFEAMAHGAIDVAVFQDGNEAELIHKVQQMALLMSPTLVPGAIKKNSKRVAKGGGNVPLILFGASTGGPLALAAILSSFPQDLAACVVIVQHVDEKFSTGLADWLTSRTPLDVELIEEETKPQPGTIYIADSKWHLILTPSETLSYSSQTDTQVYRPSIDVFFESVAKNSKNPSIAVLLTGMGADGAKGLKQLKEKGWVTIAESESSCVVFGMPKAAIEMQAATDVLDLHQISLAVLSNLRRLNQKVET